MRFQKQNGMEMIHKNKKMNSLTSSIQATCRWLSTGNLTFMTEVTHKANSLLLLPQLLGFAPA